MCGLLGMAGSAAAKGQVALGLNGLICDGPDGIVSAGVILRDGQGAIEAAGVAGRRLVPNAASPLWEPFALESPFRVASVSKMIATLGFMRLVESAKVALDDDASIHLGFQLRHPHFPDRQITVRHLLSHTSGLRNGPSYPVPAGHALKEAFEVGARHYDGGAWFGPPDRPPGSWFCYADVNFCLIAQIIERAAQERFDRYMRRTIFDPLGLDIGYNWSGVSEVKRRAAAPGVRWRDGAWSAQIDGLVPAAPAPTYPQPKEGPPVAEGDLALGVNGFLFSPQGGLRLSLRDMDRLAVFFRSGGNAPHGRIVSRQSLQAMQTPVWSYDPSHPNGDTAEGEGVAGLFSAYGLAVEIPKGTRASDGDAFFGPSSPEWRGHLGDAYGWMTGLFWNVKTGQTLVYALNGMRETGRPAGRRSALTASEEKLIDLALGLG